MRDKRFRLTLGWWVPLALLGAAALLQVGCGHRTESTAAGESSHSAAGADSDTAASQQAQGQVTLTPEAFAQSGIVLGHAAAGDIALTAECPGEIRLNAERMVEVRPPYSGLVRSLPKRLGQAVAVGEPLAVIRSKESLSDYTISATQSGTVIARSVSVGQSVDESSVLYTIADLSHVWVDLSVYPEYQGVIRRGQTVLITTQSEPPRQASGAILYVGPVLDRASRVSQARVVLPNPGGAWQPGMFVKAQVTLQHFHAAVTVPTEAIVRTSEGPAVFRATGFVFQLQPVVTGRSDSVRTEIRSGLEPGAVIVTHNPFLLKAELGRAEVEHEE